ncbi:MAG: hypothetical protein F6K14_24110, partial [Symploca sp. SIO2C1]|nr:hypothetical protein [Symploca sp. SIO2C1]
IVKPAEDVGVYIENSLVERLVADVGKEPGILPLLQKTMVLLWEKIERRFLPLKAYQTLVLAHPAYKNFYSSQPTGFQVAIANHAEHVWRNLPQAHQQIALRIFLRLIQFGQGRAHTRRQQLIYNLISVNDDPRIFKETIENLAKNRLLTLGVAYKNTKSSEREYFSTNVDIAHEALITSWPTLQAWIEKRQEAEQTRRRLMLKVEEWERLGRGNWGLLDEVELVEIRHWLDSCDASDLGYSEALFELVEVSDRIIQEAKDKEEQTIEREFQLLHKRIYSDRIIQEAKEQEEETIEQEFQLLHKRIYQEHKIRRIISIAALSTAATLLTVTITLLFGGLGWQHQSEPQTDELYQFSLTQTAFKKHTQS